MAIAAMQAVVSSDCKPSELEVQLCHVGFGWLRAADARCVVMCAVIGGHGFC